MDRIEMECQKELTRIPAEHEKVSRNAGKESENNHKQPSKGMMRRSRRTRRVYG
jgi:hypothetical protein